PVILPVIMEVNQHHRRTTKENQVLVQQMKNRLLSQRLKLKLNKQLSRRISHVVTVSGGQRKKRQQIMHKFKTGRQSS
ncbi:hypothetical protein, partial [Levilactobacillus brevis]|uniref:hypothetical protein n=1 Tax=Levilactobacillus brevis TaxID=1580 RepID=UPI0005ACC651